MKPPEDLESPLDAALHERLRALDDHISRVDLQTAVAISAGQDQLAGTCFPNACCVQGGDFPRHYQRCRCGVRDGLCLRQSDRQRDRVRARTMIGQQTGLDEGRFTAA